MAQDFIQRLGTESPHLRYTTNTALHHPFLTKKVDLLAHLPPLFNPDEIKENTVHLKQAFLGILILQFTKSSKIKKSKRSSLHESRNSGDKIIVKNRKVCRYSQSPDKTPKRGMIFSGASEGINSLSPNKPLFSSSTKDRYKELLEKYDTSEPLDEFSPSAKYKSFKKNFANTLTLNSNDVSSLVRAPKGARKALFSGYDKDSQESPLLEEEPSLKPNPKTGSAVGTSYSKYSTGPVKAGSINNLVFSGPRNTATEPINKLNLKESLDSKRREKFDKLPLLKKKTEDQPNLPKKIVVPKTPLTPKLSQKDGSNSEFDSGIQTMRDQLKSSVKNKSRILGESINFQYLAKKNSEAVIRNKSMVLEANDALSKGNKSPTHHKNQAGQLSRGKTLERPLELNYFVSRTVDESSPKKQSLYSHHKRARKTKNSNSKGEAVCQFNKVKSTHYSRDFDSGISKQLFESVDNYDLLGNQNASDSPFHKKIMILSKDSRDISNSLRDSEENDPFSDRLDSRGEPNSSERLSSKYSQGRTMMPSKFSLQLKPVLGSKNLLPGHSLNIANRKFAKKGPTTSLDHQGLLTILENKRLQHG